MYNNRIFFLSQMSFHAPFLSLHLMSLKDHTGIESSCDMTEMRIFTMARQVASALVGSNIFGGFVHLCLCVWMCVCKSPMNSTHWQWELCGFNFLQEYLHTQQCIHGNVGARSVLVGADQTAKLWGLGSAYRRRTQPNAPEAVDDMELKKWQAPEVLSRRTISPSSDVWVDIL